MNRLCQWGIALSGACLIAMAGCATSTNRIWNADRRAIADDELTAQLSLARINERQGQTDQARSIYSAVLRRDPKNETAHHRLGVIAAREAKLNEAEEHFRRASEAAPPTTELLNDIGYNLYLQDRMAEAEQAFRAALEQNPQDQRANNNLGLVLGEMGRTDESLAVFRKAVGEAEAQSNLAYARTQAGDLGTAETLYHKSISLDSSQQKPAIALLQLEGMKAALQRAQVAHARTSEASAGASAVASMSDEPASGRQVSYEQWATDAHAWQSPASHGPSAAAQQPADTWHDSQRYALPRNAAARTPGSDPSDDARTAANAAQASDDPRSAAMYRPEAIAAIQAQSSDAVARAAPRAEFDRPAEASNPWNSLRAAEAEPRRPLIGGGFSTLRSALGFGAANREPSPSQKLAAETPRPLTTSPDSPAARQLASRPSSTAVSVSLGDSKPRTNARPSSGDSPARQVSHIEEQRIGREMQQPAAVLPGRNDLRANPAAAAAKLNPSKTSSPPASPRLPTLHKNQPGRFATTRPAGEVLPQDVPMHGPPQSQQHSSRRTHAPSKAAQESPKAAAANPTSPASKQAAQTSPWQRPTWTGSSRGTLQSPLPLGSMPQALTNPFAAGGAFRSSGTNK